MYILSFAKSFFKPKSILTTLYFIMNNLLIFGIFMLFNMIDFSAGEVNGVYNGLVGVGINLVFVILTLSPVGEAILRFQLKASRLDLTRDDDNKLLQLFNEVYTAALEESPHLGSKIKLYVVRTQELNAAALGQRTLIVNSGLLTLPEDQIKAIMAHEFGHLAHRDGDMHLAVCVSNFILTILVSIFRLFVRIFAIFSIFSDNRDRGLIFLALYIIEAVVSLLFYFWLWIGMVLVNVTSRKNEFAADAYACTIGYGKELYRALETMDSSKKKSSFFALISRTHPDTVVRLEKISENVII